MHLLVIIAFSAAIAFWPPDTLVKTIPEMSEGPPLLLWPEEGSIFAWLGECALCRHRVRQACGQIALQPQPNQIVIVLSNNLAPYLIDGTPCVGGLDWIIFPIKLRQTLSLGRASMGYSLGPHTNYVQGCPVFLHPKPQDIL